jgi:ribonuclease HI
MSGTDALLAIRRDKKTVAEAGSLAALLDEPPEVYFDPLALCAWKVKTLQEIDDAVAAIPAQEADEVVLAENVPEHEKRELMRRILQNLQKRLATEVKTSDMAEIRATASRNKPIRMLGAEWEVSFTDGSKRRCEDEKEDKASWGIFLPKSHEDAAQTSKSRGKLPGNVIAHRVDGAQTSQRAELAAIYAALSAHKGSERNQLVVSDSEMSIKLLARWRNGVPASAVRKCRNRDLLRLVLDAEKELKGTVRYVHVYSHQNEAKAARKAKIDAQKAQYGAEDYATMVKGNEIVDRAAGIATKQETKRRNWATSPMRGVDPMYLTYRESDDGPVLFMDMAPHSWIKEQTQQRIIQEQSDRGKRGAFLVLMPLVDKKRSFAAGNSRNCHQHKTYIALAKLRLHATPTATRSYRRARALDATNPYKKFFQHLYPDKKCFACKQKGIDVEEDTAHMVACPSRDDRRAASVELWNKVYQTIRENQGPNALDARFLRPFALRTPETMALTLHQLGPAGGAHIGAALADVAAFPDDAAALGLIPRKLEAALAELGVVEAAKTADTVAQLVQSAVAADITARHRAIATGQGQKALFRVHVLGLQPLPNPA